MTAKSKIPPHRIIVKFGSGILTRKDGNALDHKQINRLVAEISALIRDGHEFVIVSSGAVAAGLRTLGLKIRPDFLAERQACAAVGQTKLMHAYETAFAKHDLCIAQMLLTHGDLDSRMRHANAGRTLEHLFKNERVVPIINENDSVAVEELNFGDNDQLSAEVAMLANADLLILLTSVDGLLDDKGRTISKVNDISKVAHFATDDKGKFSTGGMVSKLQAVQLATECGIPTVIANGRREGEIAAILAGKSSGTRFSKAGKSAEKK